MLFRSNDPILSDPLRWGFQGFLTKPYRVDDVARVLSRVVPRPGERKPPEVQD